MDVMARYADKHFDLAIVDVPYGIDAGNMQHGKGNKNYKKSNFDKIKCSQKYFDELFRVSKNQIIFGANYYQMPIQKGFIIWDKRCGIVPERDQADCEYAYTSFGKVARIARILYDGFLGSDKYKIHPTQKPVALYKWLLRNYAKHGDLILDTHVGSASSLIAFEDCGFDYVGCELDADYFASACARIKDFRADKKLPLTY